MEYADAQGKPVVVSNSWGSQWGPHDGTGSLASFVSRYFGESHPNHIILFASSNDANHATGSDGGGFFVKKSAASQASPLGSIIRTKNNGGNSYDGTIASAWASSKLNCKLYVLSNTTGEVLKSWTVTSETNTFEDLDTYYTGSMTIYAEGKDSRYCVGIISNEGLTSTSNNAYTLAIEVYPEAVETTADINMWAGDDSYFTSHLTTAGHSWTNGTNDMCVSDQATIPDAISVGAYMSRFSWPDYTGESRQYISSYNPEGDIANFSSYATAAMSPTGLAYPWITAPGAAVIAGVNHFHTTEIDNNSYFHANNTSQLVVNNDKNPYGMMQGTSMATPVAAGIVALWLQAASEQNKTLTVNQVKEIMSTSAINDEFTTTGSNASHFGNGKIDALAGISAVSSISGGLLLADNADNSTTISNHNGPATTVTLSGRTLYKDGYWNTLCLPFSLTAEQVTAQLAPTALKELDVTGTYDTNKQTGFDAQTGTLNLYFKDATVIEAGKPYLIKWASKNAPAANLVSPVFSGVTIDANASTEVSFTGGKFKGTYAPIAWNQENQSILFLGVKNNKNTLYYPQSGAGIKAFRAYFQLSDGQQASAFNLVFDSGVDTGISEISNEELGMRNGNDEMRNGDYWYTLSGTRLIAKPTKPGLYINNGRKVVIK